MRLLRSASVYMARSDQEVVLGMAKEVFEMRTLKEIKDALDRCISDDKPCSSCVYDKFEAFKCCIDMMLIDTQNCICELEAKVPKWVSVKDRLPEHVRGNYLILLSGEIYAAKWEYDEWNEKYAFRIDCQIVPNITHWMKVPEPPKEENYDGLS